MLSRHLKVAKPKFLLLFACFFIPKLIFIPVLTKTTLAEVRHIMNLNCQESLFFSGIC